MPRGDKTGPTGLGSKTGRAAGYCAGFSVPGYMNPTYVYERGLGRRRGKPAVEDGEEDLGVNDLFTRNP